MFRRSHDRDASLFGILAAARTALRDGKDVMNRIVRYLMLAGAWTACIIGCIGVFVPVLPTTRCCCSRRSCSRNPRRAATPGSSRPGVPHLRRRVKEAGGIPLGTKVRILAVSFTLMGLSAWFVQKPLVWAILGCVSAFLLYLMFVRIPTITPERVQLIRQVEKAE